jgi:hypothetical protein
VVGSNPAIVFGKNTGGGNRNAYIGYTDTFFFTIGFFTCARVRLVAQTTSTIDNIIFTNFIRLILFLDGKNNKQF